MAVKYTNYEKAVVVTSRVMSKVPLNYLVLVESIYSCAIPKVPHFKKISLSYVKLPSTKACPSIYKKSP